MADHPSDRIDPRFNPAFQRGFEGEVEFAPARPSRAPAGAVTEAPHRYPAGQQAVQQQSAQQVGPPPGNPVAEQSTAGAVRADSSTEPDHYPDEIPSGGVNPFLIGLLVVAAALIATGVFMFQWSRDLMNISNQVDFILAQSVIYAAPLTIALGISTAIGVAFVYAVRWRGKISR